KMRDLILQLSKSSIYSTKSVFIRTSQDYLVNKAGRHFSIVPGMIATVDIKTGEKTVLDYMIKLFNRAKEALRER
ncbi:secretion protein HlyD, partial [Enterobacter cloacae complex sp. IR5418]